MHSIDLRHAEPVYAPAPVVRAAAFEAWPQVRPALAPVFAGLDLETLRALNEKVAVEGEDSGRRRAGLSRDAEPVVTRGGPKIQDRVLLTLLLTPRRRRALPSAASSPSCRQSPRQWRGPLPSGARLGRMPV